MALFCYYSLGFQFIDKTRISIILSLELLMTRYTLILSIMHKLIYCAKLVDVTSVLLILWPFYNTITPRVRGVHFEFVFCREVVNLRGRRKFIRISCCHLVQYKSPGSFDAQYIIRKLYWNRKGVVYPRGCACAWMNTKHLILWSMSEGEITWTLWWIVKGLMLRI